ncbi:MAG: hypothetical protein ACLQIH_06790 [Myxococcaceae bacterium]
MKPRFQVNPQLEAVQWDMYGCGQSSDAPRLWAPTAMTPSLIAAFVLLVAPSVELSSQLLAQTPLPPAPSQTQPQLAPQQQLNQPPQPKLGAESLTPPTQPQLAPQQRLSPTPQLAPPGQPVLAPVAPMNPARDGGTSNSSGAAPQPAPSSTVRADAGP